MLLLLLLLLQQLLICRGRCWYGWRLLRLLLRLLMLLLLDELICSAVNADGELLRGRRRDTPV